MDLEVAGADRRLDPVAVAARLGERLRDRRLARAEEAQHAAARRRVARASRRRSGSRLERVRPEPPQLARRPGQDDDDAAVVLEHEARRRSGEAERDARPPAPSPACGRPRSKSAYGRRSRSANAREMPPISASEPSSSDERAPGHAREQLDRAVVVGRPEAAGDDAEVGASPSRAPRSSSLGPSPTIAIRAGSRPSDSACAREERAVPVGALAAHELAARDDDDGARPRGRPAQPRRRARSRRRATATNGRAVARRQGHATPVDPRDEVRRAASPRARAAADQTRSRPRSSVPS